MLSEIELRRYQRQISNPDIGKAGQIQLKQSKVLITGLGGSGSATLQYLAAAGVGTLGLCDNAYVEEGNFCRQIIYGSSDLGKLKTIVAKEKMKTHNPFVTCQIHNIKLKPDNAAMLVKGYHLVADCSGSPETLSILAPVCKELNASLLSCIVDNHLIKLALLPLSETENKIQLPWSHSEISQPKTHANTGAVYGIAGSIVANETLKILLGKGAADNPKLITFDLFNMQMQTSNL